MIPIFQVDAFASKPFTGNPAGVCLLDRERPAEWMQKVAQEMNLSETAFPLPVEDGYHLRWFTPAVEVALCGHATLATAHILWETGRLKDYEAARFHTLSGLLTCEKQGEWIVMDFPLRPVEPARPPEGLLDALGITEPLFTGTHDWGFLVEVEDEAILRSMAPDFTALKQVPTRAVVVTCRGDESGYDFCSRFFAPGVGVNEDPVTGSAHCSLAPYWSERLNKSEFSAFQASARGGELRVWLADGRVRIAGQAITVLRGELID